MRAISFRRYKLLVCGCVVIAATLLCAQTDEAGKRNPSGSSAKAGSRQHKTSSVKGSRSKKTRKTASSRRRGQEKIDSQRAQQIQAALIREHYLSGKPSGVWDSATQAALQKYQADNGWQSKTIPDSRALIKLGLGPDHEHLLNPESAMTSQIGPHGASPSAHTAPADPLSNPSQPQK